MLSLPLSTTAVLANDFFFAGGRVTDPETSLDAIRNVSIERSHVRERGLLSLSEAIRKMSLLPAQTLEESVPQMRTKGRLQVGMDADIVVFARATVADLATFENVNRPTVGVQTVIVNDGFSVRHGKLVLDAPNGRAKRNAVVN